MLLAPPSGGAQQKKSSHDLWRIYANREGGAITLQTSEADLVRLYGRENVEDGDVYIGEGYSEPGTILFRHDPERRLEIIWKDHDERRFPRQIRTPLHESRRSVWKTSFGITIGTALLELERINRRPFILTGFGWDYGGTTISWRGGRLEPEFAGKNRVLLRLEPEGDVITKEMRAVMGDRNFSSGHPAMQKLNPTVYQILWEFRE